MTLEAHIEHEQWNDRLVSEIHLTILGTALRQNRLKPNFPPQALMLGENWLVIAGLPAYKSVDSDRKVEEKPFSVLSSVRYFEPVVAGILLDYVPLDRLFRDFAQELRCFEDSLAYYPITYS